MLKGTVYFFVLGVCATHFVAPVFQHLFVCIGVLSLFLAISFFVFDKRYIVYGLSFMVALLFSKAVMERELNERIQFSPSTIKTSLSATLYDIQKKPEYYILYFKAPDFDSELFNNVTHLRLTTRHPLEFTAGQIWQFQAVLKSPVGASSWGAFDYERWLIANDIDATGYIPDKTEMRMVHSPSTQSLSWQWKQYWQERLGLNVNNSEPTHAIIYALLTADRQFLSDEQWSYFRATGTSHLMAISGMHIGFIALISFLLFKGVGYFSSVFSQLKWQLLFTLSICIVYGVLTNWQIPVQRAVLMISLAYLMSISGFKISPFFALVLIGCIVLVISPMSIIDTGFWLSFSAVAMILWVLNVRHFKSKPTEKGFQKKLTSNFKTALRIQWGLSILLLPLTAFFFGYLPLVSFFANLVAIPVISFIVMPSLFLISISSLFPSDLFQQCLMLIASILDVLTDFLNYLSSLQFGIDFIPTIIEFVLVSIVLFMLWLLPNKLTKLGLVSIIAIVCLGKRDNGLEQGEFMLTTLDVGRGLSQIVQTQHHTFVFDLGEMWGNSSATERIVYPFLLHNKIRDVDKLVISHNDSDHVGDIEFFTEKVQIKELYAGNELMSDLPQTNCHQANDWSWDGVNFKWLKSDAVDDSSNNASCVLFIESEKGEKGSALLTGDITQKREKKIISDYPILQASIDVLSTPHHGSKTSSSQAFLEFIQPTYAITSANVYNRYKHPAKKISKRLERLNIKHLQTGKLGSIRVSFKDDIEIKTHRKSNMHWWKMRFE